MAEIAKHRKTRSEEGRMYERERMFAFVFMFMFVCLLHEGPASLSVIALPP